MNEVVQFDKIETFVKNLREKKSLKIAFTNGCFDLIHRGHVEYLEKAKQKADVLIVGLNSDKSVHHLKGQDRPYINQEDRAFILSRLESVDVVSIFDQDTPLEMIKKVQPDLLIKGGDYDVGEIVGGAFVKRSGGDVLIIPLVSGRSTSKLLKEIKSQNR